MTITSNELLYGPLTTIDITNLNNYGYINTTTTLSTGITYTPNIITINSNTMGSYSYGAQGSTVAGGGYSIGSGMTGSSYSPPYLSIGTFQQPYGYVTNIGTDPSWYDPMQIAITINGETKFIPRSEAEKILQQHFLVENLAKEFPQVKYEKDKLDVVVKLHTDDDEQPK